MNPNARKRAIFVFLDDDCLAQPAHSPRLIMVFFGGVKIRWIIINNRRTEKSLISLADAQADQAYAVRL